MEKRLVGLTLVLAIFLIGFASASLQEDIYNKIGNKNLTINSIGCEIVGYKLLSNYLNGLSIEVNTLESEEHFYLILVEENCSWRIDLENFYFEVPDVLLNKGVGNESSMHANTLRGKMLMRLIKNEI